jgi:hypothetical protein|tara:strand:+ start:999 stop:1535 length:537 start_codon:yes stop_codon:yes gene_type:complete
MHDKNFSVNMKLTDGANWPVVGEGVFSWSVFRFYRARLMSASGQFDPKLPYRLEITYLRRLSGSQISQVTGAEMKRLAQAGVASCVKIPSTTIDTWVKKLEQFLPDVSLSDQLVGVFQPAQGVWFFDAEHALGHIAEPSFVQAFTAIWLDPQTRAPKLRGDLLKIADNGNTQFSRASS